MLQLGLNFLKCPKSRRAQELTAAFVGFSYIRSVSRGSVATQLRCGRLFNSHITANFPQSVPAKEFLKSVNIWQRHGQKFGGMLYTTSKLTDEFIR